MQIFINDDIKKINTESTTLIRILEEEGLSASEGIAIAINNKVIPKADWEKYLLKENDHLTIIKAVQGG
jgi:sulfur carrier protein